MRSVRRIIGLLAVTALVAASCGTDEGGNGDGGGTTD